MENDVTFLQFTKASLPIVFTASPLIVLGIVMFPDTESTKSVIITSPFSSNL